jgi:hypothetical protein
MAMGLLAPRHAIFIGLYFAQNNSYRICIPLFQSWDLLLMSQRRPQSLKGYGRILGAIYDDLLV